MNSLIFWTHQTQAIENSALEWPLNIVNPVNNSLEEIRTSFKKAINIIRNEAHVVITQAYRIVLIDGACPELVEGPHPEHYKFQITKSKIQIIYNF